MYSYRGGDTKGLVIGSEVMACRWMVQI